MGRKRNEDGDQLTDVEKQFADAYRSDPRHNATIAYQKVFNVRYDIAKSRAYRLLKTRPVAEYIKRRDKYALVGEARKSDISVGRVLRSIARGAFWDVKELLDKDGKYKEVHKIDRDTRLAITGFRQNGLPIMMDKQKSLELLGRVHALFTEKRELTGADGEPLFDGQVNVNVKFVKPTK